MEKRYYVYIMTNRRNDVLYTGVTNDLRRRVYEHKAGEMGGFTSRYKIKKLVYFEVFDSIDEAIAREKRIKGGSRMRKIKLVDRINEEWMDLSYCV
ncbi:MAG: GIY-YIG nuclease family protein [Actinobacteria bacterium]|jgi:putative endonuclease|nr:MAG: GIY-YIG nuclease family protein [Actinomycetota bacterium]